MKKITDLQLISAVVDGISIPIDNGIQTYRMTVLQLKNFLLSAGAITLAMLNTSIFNGLTAVDPENDDYVPGVDTSDSNLTKKFLVSKLRNPAVRAISSYPATINATDQRVYLSGTSGTVNLPALSGLPTGWRIEFIHDGTTDSEKYTLDGNSTETLGGLTTFDLATNGDRLVIEKASSTNFRFVHNGVDVSARYNTAAGQSISNNTTTIVDFGTKVFDANDRVTNAAGVWKYTHVGPTRKFNVSAMVTYAAAAGWASGEHVNIGLYKNNSLVCTLDGINVDSTASIYQCLTGSAIVELASTDFVDVRTTHINGGTLGLLNSADWNWINVNPLL